MEQGGVGKGRRVGGEVSYHLILFAMRHDNVIDSTLTRFSSEWGLEEQRCSGITPA